MTLVNPIFDHLATALYLWAWLYMGYTMFIERGKKRVRTPGLTTAMWTATLTLCPGTGFLLMPVGRILNFYF